MRRTKSISVVTLAGVGLVGCLFAGCVSATAKFYVLVPSATAPAASSGTERAEALTVELQRLPEFLDRRQIVTRRGDNQLHYHEFHRWAGSLRSEILRVVVANLGVLLQTDRVALYSASPRFALDYRVMLEIERFDGELGRELALDVRWTVSPGDGGNALVVSHSALREELHSSSYEELVRAHSALLSALSSEIAARIRAHSDRKSF